VKEPFGSGSNLVPIARLDGADGYTYTETPAGASTEMIFPMQGSTLGISNVQFTWSASTGVTKYSLWLGTSDVGSSNLYTSRWITSTSAIVPAKGVAVYARLYSMINGKVQSSDYTYIEQ
jgi:hypothetical protein